MTARILIVDDEAKLGRLLCETLEGLGHEVSWVQTGADALARVDAGGVEPRGGHHEELLDVVPAVGERLPHRPRRRDVVLLDDEHPHLVSSRGP